MTLLYMQDEAKLLIWFIGFAPLPENLENSMCRKFNPIPFLKNKNMNLPIQQGGRWYEWFAAEETSCNNASISYFNDIVDTSILDDEGKACDIIAILSIKSTFDNDHIHVLHYLPNRYLYRY